MTKVFTSDPKAQPLPSTIEIDPQIVIEEVTGTVTEIDTYTGTVTVVEEIVSTVEDC